MFTGLWAKITAGLGAIIGVLFVMLKIKNNKIENLEEENFGLGKLNEIDNTVEKAEIKAREIEENARKDFDDQEWKDKI